MAERPAKVRLSLTDGEGGHLPCGFFGCTRDVGAVISFDLSLTGGGELLVKTLPVCSAHGELIREAGEVGKLASPIFLMCLGVEIDG